MTEIDASVETSHDCPDCSTRLKGEKRGEDYAVFECPECGSQFEGVQREDGSIHVTRL